MSWANETLDKLRRQPGGSRNDERLKLSGLHRPPHFPDRPPVLEFGLVLLTTAALALASILVAANDGNDSGLDRDSPTGVTSVAVRPPMASVDARPPVTAANDRPAAAPMSTQASATRLMEAREGAASEAGAAPGAVADEKDGSPNRAAEQADEAVTQILRIEPAQSLQVRREIGAERLYRKGLEQAERGRLAAARRSFQQALSLAPEHHGARTQLAIILIRLRQLESARTELEKGLALDLNHTPFLVLKARVFLENGETDEAVALLESAPPRHRRDAEYGTLLGALYQRQGRTADAVAVYRRVLEDNPDNARCWMGLGLALDAEGHQDRALLAYHAAQRLGGAERKSRRWLAARIRSLEEVSREEARR